MRSDQFWLLGGVAGLKAWPGTDLMRDEPVSALRGNLKSQQEEGETSTEQGQRAADEDLLAYIANDRVTRLFRRSRTGTRGGRW